MCYLKLATFLPSIPLLLFTLDNISELQTAITHKISTQTAIYCPRGKKSLLFTKYIQSKKNEHFGEQVEQMAIFSKCTLKSLSWISVIILLQSLYEMGRSNRLLVFLLSSSTLANYLYLPLKYVVECGMVGKLSYCFIRYSSVQ